MTSTRERLDLLAWAFGLGFVVVAVHLLLLMVQQQDTWAARSHENRWAFRAVPSQRGALLDRQGRPLAFDEPDTELAVHYVVFRRRHPIGAVVHGATTWLRHCTQGSDASFGYLPGPLDPEAALRTLLAIPVRAFAKGALLKAVAGELASAVTTVLAACTGRSRTQVFAALRAAARVGDERTVAELDLPPLPELVAAFRQRVDALARLDAALAPANAQPATADEPQGLLGTLEFLRTASLAGARVTWVEKGKQYTGSKLEEVRRTFARSVPFDLAAEVRVAGEHFAGIDVVPSVRRVRTVADCPLRVLLGDVVELDRALPSERWLETRLERELPPDWLEDLEALDDAGAAVDRDQVAAEARATYVRQLLQHERRGTTGLEAAFDDELAGRLGMRLVEQDSRRREHRQWGHLRGLAGNDVRTTLDLDLQRLAEAAATAAWQRMRNLHEQPDDADKVEAALAVIDARTGDVLAYAGAPVVSPGVRDLPGVVWVLNGDLGSVVKPFVLVEQLQSEALGRPHRALATLEDCNKHYRYPGGTVHCSHAHGASGRDPVEALAESCNVFYYQCGIGLGDDGIARALRRFGLAPLPEDGVDAFAACWQPRVPGLPVAHPKRDDKRYALPQRAVGYGVEASPVHVARAYAGLATGFLPTLGLRPEPRPRVPLDDVASELAMVQEGLRACVQRGTARKLPLLNELGVSGKTGTAEIGRNDQNNAWFAGWMPEAGDAGAQLCFCAVVYWVKDQVHGGEAAGQVVVDFLTALQADPVLQRRWLLPGGGR